MLVGSILLLAGAIGQQPPRSPEGSKPPRPTSPGTPPVKTTPAKADPQAAALLQEAIQSVDPKKLAWVETTLWQLGNLQGLIFQVDGKYLAAPKHRMHLDMHVHVGGTTGHLEVISDGTTVWDVHQVGEGEKLIFKKSLSQVLESLSAPNILEQVRDEFFRAESFSGMAPLLQNIQQRMTVTGQEKVQWNGREMTRLSAVWSADSLKNLPTADNQWLPYLPNQCRVYLLRLGDQTWWPYRVEWWGPAPPVPGDTLLLQMEYRSPKLNKELSPEQLAREFSFNPGNAEVKDFTKEVSEAYRIRSQQLAAQTKAK
jgi:hypothetical protein